MIATLLLKLREEQGQQDTANIQSVNSLTAAMKNSCYVFALILLPIAACGGSAIDGITIADVQGNGPASPMEGETVSVEGIVTGDFQSDGKGEHGDLGGFYLQAEHPDADAATSDGVFVYEGASAMVDVRVGNKVIVTGVVKEYFGETQINAATVSIIGTGTVQAISLVLPATNTIANSDGEPIADLERFEGMLVRIAEPLTINELYFLERYGELTLASGGRLFQFTNGNSPDVTGYASHREAIAARMLVLDDGYRNQSNSPIRHLETALTSGSSIRVGDSVENLTGNLRFARGSGGNGRETWRLMPTSRPKFVTDNPRPGAPDIGGELRVASFNVLNLFSTVDSGDRICGPVSRSGCRGADSAAERLRQLEKTTTALLMIDADIVGLIELENNAHDSLQVIVNSLNATAGANTYAFLDTGTVGNDAIKTGFVFKPARVRTIGRHAVLDSSIDPRFKDHRNRAALAQTFSQRSNDARLTIVVNHFKSKASSCERDGDPNRQDGQGNCNQTRSAAAAAIVNWLASDPTASGDPDFLIVGDLNAYGQEDPLQVLAHAGFVNLLEFGNKAEAYSYIFGSQSGALDHALASPSLSSQVAQTIEWHINADESPAHDYNLENGRDPAIFDGSTPYRASDHDPIIIGLDLSN